MPILRVHHLNCATLRPIGGRLIADGGALWHRAQWVSHCLLIELDHTLVLIDSGLGTDDVTGKWGRAHTRHLKMLLWAALRPEETAFAQIVKLGLDPRDVGHIILTHLDLDHAGGLADFPNATVHVMAAEHEAAMARRSLKERIRYSPFNWAHQPRWAQYDIPNGETWLGFAAVRELTGLPPEIMILPLSGHTRGHAAVAVKTPSGWLLHAGDTYVHRNQIHSDHPCPKGLRVFERWITATDYDTLAHNQSRLRDLAGAANQDVRVFSSHDPVEFQACLDHPPYF